MKTKNVYSKPRMQLYKTSCNVKSRIMLGIGNINMLKQHWHVTNEARKQNYSLWIIFTLFYPKYEKRIINDVKQMIKLAKI